MNHNLQKQIVLVEDDQDLMYFLKNYLQRSNYQVFAFSTGQEGVDYINQTDEKPDLAIFDYTLPDMTGLQVADSLKRWTESRVPTVFLSAESDLGTKLRTSPFSIVMRKPVELFDLRIVIESLLANESLPTHQVYRS